MRWERIKKELHWAGPAILTCLGILWLVQGYELMPFSAPWFGGILVLIGVVRLVLFKFGFY